MRLPNVREKQAVRFTLYTEKTVPQCLSAINARLQAKGTPTRPGLDGWIDRSGEFSLGVTQPVIGKFQRTTRLKGRLERQSGYTVITGVVPGGSNPRERWVGLGALVVMGLLVALAGKPLIALLLIPVGFWMYIPMVGDYVNGPLLLTELQRALKAKATPPKASDPAAAPATRKSSATASRTPGRTPSATGSTRTSVPRPAPKPAPILSADEDDDDDSFTVDEDAQPRLL
jgi:hypothetical protein